MGESDRPENEPLSTELDQYDPLTEDQYELSAEEQYELSVYDDPRTAPPSVLWVSTSGEMPDRRVRPSAGPGSSSSVSAEFVEGQMGRS
jgi:hypothetical protein